MNADHSDSEPLLKSQREPLLQLSDLTVDFDTPTGWVRCLYGVDMEVYPGEILGLVGESGSGKSVTCMAVMQLLGPRALIRGNVRYRKQDLLGFDEKGLTQMRGREIAMIFQDPMSSLNPVHTIGRQVIESITYNTDTPVLNPTDTIGDQVEGVVEEQLGLTGQAAREEARRLLARVGIPDPKQRLREYPHQMSGGMSQRAMIAMAMSCDPKVLIADEPTTALDVTIQAQIFELMDTLKSEFNTAIMLITHDMGVVTELADDVVVMYMGNIVETGTVGDVLRTPSHPYTKALLQSIPILGRGKNQEIEPIRGTTPDPYKRPEGCQFMPRCDFADDTCLSMPDESKLSSTHSVRCWHPLEV